MHRKTTLKPRILRYLDETGKTNLDLLVKHLNKETGVSAEKIKFRIEKMISEGDLLVTNGTVSRILSSKSQTGQAFDEISKVGPMTLGRKGNVISMKSEFGKKNVGEIRRNAKKALPLVKKDVEEGLKEIEKLILENYDPLDVVAFVSTKNMLTDPETDTESSFKGSQLLPEIVQNIVLKNDLEKYTGEDREDIDKFHELTNNLRSKLLTYLLTEALARDDLTSAEADVYFHVMNNFLWVRGDAYPQHYKEIALELFSKINDVLKNKGYTIEEYWATVDEIDRQIRYNFNEPSKKLRLEHAKFIEFSENEIKKGTKPSEIVGKYRQDAAERIKSLQSDFKKLSEIALKGSFEMEVNNKTNQKLLNSLSMKFGENRQWTNPLDKSNIAIKPIVRANEKYYCFLTPHLTRNAIPIIESQLTQSDREKTAYSDVKGNYFETKTIQLLNKVIMGKAYHNLFYPKGNEIDGIIVLNDMIFLIEAKGKKKRIIAGVGDVLGLTKEDFIAHIVDAFDQTKRASEYIQSKEEVEFRDKNGTVILTIRRGNIRKLYQINVCLNNFSKLALDINLVKTWIPDMSKIKDYPWIVSIYDLMVISDLLEKETAAFVTYLDERLRVAESSSLEAVDEIDYLGYFLENGNLDTPKDLKSANFTLITGFSEKIDRWYSYLRGEVTKAEKPALKKRFS
jgi:hypothetical protein